MRPVIDEQDCKIIADKLKFSEDNGYHYIACNKHDIDILNKALDKCRTSTIKIPVMDKKNICKYTINGITLENNCCVKIDPQSNMIVTIIICVTGGIMAILTTIFFVRQRQTKKTP